MKAEKEIEITPLPTTLEEAYAYASKNGRIVPWAEYGQHIPLTCVNHSGLTWSTKNISCIGARSLFFDLYRVAAKRGESECSCPLSSLIPVVPVDWQSKIVP